MLCEGYSHPAHTAERCLVNKPKDHQRGKQRFMFQLTRAFEQGRHTQEQQQSADDSSAIRSGQRPNRRDRYATDLGELCEYALMPWSQREQPGLALVLSY